MVDVCWAIPSHTSPQLCRQRHALCAETPAVEDEPAASAEEEGAEEDAREDGLDEEGAVDQPPALPDAEVPVEVRDFPRTQAWSQWGHRGV